MNIVIDKAYYTSKPFDEHAMPFVTWVIAGANPREFEEACARAGAAVIRLRELAHLSHRTYIRFTAYDKDGVSVTNKVSRA